MPKSENDCRIAGHAGRDAEQKGNGPVKFSIATGGGNKKDSEEKWPTHWHTIVAWGGMKDKAMLVSKGGFVRVTGRLEYNDWVGKDGLKHHDAQIVATEIELEDGAVERQAQSIPQGSVKPLGKAQHEITDDDIPF